MNENKKLPPDFKAKWVAALRSGEYKQGRTKLRIDSPDGCKYCTIGVFAVANEIEISKDGLEMVINDDHVGYRPIDDLIGYDEVQKIYRMNDTKRLSFSEIADYIEKNP